MVTAPAPAVCKTPKSVFHHHKFSAYGTFVPTMCFIRSDRESPTAVVGVEAGEMLRNPVDAKNFLSGYQNFRLQLKSDIIADKDKSWELLLKKKTGEHRVTRQVAVREFFRTFLEGLSGIDRKLLFQKTLYIGKPAYSELGLEQRYVTRIGSICSELGFESKPVFVYEPYAIAYYCLHLAHIQFPAPAKRRRTRILVVDHGGGTISTCIVELNSLGKVDTDVKPVRPISRCDSGGRMLDEILLRQLISRSNLPEGSKRQLLSRGRPAFPFLDQALLVVETAKIQCMEKANGNNSTEIALHFESGLPNVPCIDASLTIADVAEGFDKLWESRCIDCIRYTLEGDDERNIDHVILAGGSCRSGFHHKLIEKYFASYLDGGTRFVDISAEKTAVAAGICYQALLDRADDPDISLAVKRIATSQNLSDVVAQDLVVQLQSNVPIDGTPEVLGETTIVKSGAAKSDIWSGPNVGLIGLKHKLPQRFWMSVANRSEIEQEGSSDIRHAITIKSGRLRHRQLIATVTMTANDEGTCHPQIAVAPRAAPNYLEPDHKRFHITIPDLVRSDVQAFELGDIPHVLSIDFGSAMSCAVSIDILEASVRQEHSQPLLDNDANFCVYHASKLNGLNGDSRSIDPQFKRIIAELRRSDQNAADCLERFLIDFYEKDKSLQSGQTNLLRTSLERLLNSLASDSRLRAAGVKKVNLNGNYRYTRRQQIAFVLTARKTKHPKQQARIEELVFNMADVAYKRASDIVHGDVVAERSEVERILNLIRTSMFELLDL
jgi:hypothetical protein